MNISVSSRTVRYSILLVALFGLAGCGGGGGSGASNPPTTSPPLPPPPIQIGLDEVAKLISPNFLFGPQFGFSVSLSGNTAAISSPYERVSGFGGAGVTRIFENDGSNNWTHRVGLAASDVQIGGRFGWSVSIAGDILAISACDCGQVTNDGSVYVFERDQLGDWSEKTKLEGSIRQLRDKYGYSVAVSGEFVVIGAPSRNRTFVFSRDRAGSWLEQTVLTASDVASGQRRSFGHHVAIDNDRIMVSALGATSDTSGAVYVFEHDGFGAWTEVAIISPTDDLSNGAGSFGFSLAFSNEILVVGVNEADGVEQQSGAVYIFIRDGNGDWQQHDRLTASDGVTNQKFGDRVAYANEIVLVAAPNDSEAGFPNSGAIYAYVRQSDGHWAEEVKVVASDGAASDFFGNAVALTNTHALIGAKRDDFDSGSVYVFEVN